MFRKKVISAIVDILSLAAAVLIFGVIFFCYFVLNFFDEAEALIKEKGASGLLSLVAAVLLFVEISLLTFILSWGLGAAVAAILAVAIFFLLNFVLLPHTDSLLYMCKRSFKPNK